MILAREEILKALAEGELGIAPFNEELLGAASIDLRLSRYFRRLLASTEPVDVLPQCDYRDPAISTVIEIPKSGFIDLQSGETVLGLTVERVRLGSRLCGRLEGRSRFARLGLLIHISAGFMAPGTDNQQVLEISNMSPRPLRLYPDTAICQCIFERMGSPATHQGRYQNQVLDDFINHSDSQG